MNATDLTGIPPRLWPAVAAARHRLLMLDYDGTIAPFQVDRDQAVPLPRAVELIRTIALQPRTTVAVISGRPVRELEDFLGAVPASLVGEHGWERRTTRGTIVRRALRPEIELVLAEAAEAARVRGWGDLLERKRASVVLHTRSLPAATARAIEDRCVVAWLRVASSYLVGVDRIHGGVELRALGLDKGIVALSLISQSGPGTLAVFVGDDRTDEDAFEAVAGCGYGVRVGVPGGATHATARLPDCAAVVTFLEAWAQTVAAAPAVRTVRP